MEAELFQFPVLNFNGISARILQYTSQKIKPTDLSNGAKVDELLCRFLLEFFAISLNPAEKVSYALNLMRIFHQMRYPESFLPSDFADDRDSKKMSRLLSWLFQFVEALEPAQQYAFEILNSFKEKSSQAVALRKKIASLKISSESDEEKRSDYQNRIVELRSMLSEKLVQKAKVDEEVHAEAKKLNQLLESERANSLEATNLKLKLEELKSREENWKAKIIDNPNLPQATRELQDKINSLELEMQEIISKTYQVNQSISDYKQLHEVIERQLVSVCRDCHSLLLQISHSKFNFSKLGEEIVDRTTGLDELNKKLTDLTESLRLLEHKVVKERVVEAAQSANDEQVKKAKTALLDKYCVAHKSLESDVNMLTAVLDTTKTSYEKEYNNKERGEDEKKVEEMSSTLQSLYQVYAQTLDWQFSFDES